MFNLNVSSKILVITILTSIVGGVFYVGFLKVNDYKTELALKNEKIQTMILENKKGIDLLKKNIDLFKYKSEGKVEDLKLKIDQEKKIRLSIESQKESQNEKISDLEKRLSKTNTSIDLTSVIKDWQPLVTTIKCDFNVPDSKKVYETSGSGIILKFGDKPVKVLTNRHVILGNGLHNLSFCKVKLPEEKSEFVVNTSEIEVSTSKYDWGVLVINNPDEIIKDIVKKSNPSFCNQKPSLGDKVLVLGYPSIGSKNGVTATEGIISGFDDAYFITSAKVDQGNSGGAAILSKENCLLGIPTYASLGQVESLARILDIWKVVTK